jgi:hypothetical protein
VYHICIYNWFINTLSAKTNKTTRNSL